MATALRPLSRARSADRSIGRRLTNLALLLFFVGPMLMGVVGTILPALGILPQLGGVRFSPEPFRQLLEVPGLARASGLSLGTGLATTALSFLIVVALAAHWHGTPWFSRIRRLVSPLLAVPHVAIAIGFAFLIAPSGWIYRLLAATGLAGPLPPDIPIVQDPHGIALILGLTLKEVPFLLLMMLVAMGQVPVRENLTVARILGHERSAAWLAVVLPQLYPQLRLPIYAVLAYSASVVDVALILGPTTPPTLAVLVWRGFQDPDLDHIFWASAGACLQLGLIALTILLWRCGEVAVASLGRRRILAGWPGRPPVLAAACAACGSGAVVVISLVGLAAMVLWSLAQRWTISSAFPEGLSLNIWRQQLTGEAGLIGTTALLAIASASAALLLVIAVLEQEVRQGAKAQRRHRWLIYVPLILPQIGFLFGIQVLLVVVGLDGTWVGLVWTHLLFVLPYVYLSLSEPWRALDPRYERTALCLGHSPVSVLLTIKAPLLARPILVALALGFAVSVGQYLPTLFAGGGRFQTVTTEAVTLSASGDRRVIGVYASLQMLLPALGFAAALALTGRGRRVARANS
ncbi:MAG TPA: ABC transporter permease [Alphaproteobacteria bacterium]|nr:ABC transporter permease [Alphaproteobacteria bacterium]